MCSLQEQLANFLRYRFLCTLSQNSDRQSAHEEEAAVDLSQLTYNAKNQKWLEITNKPVEKLPESFIVHLPPLDTWPLAAAQTHSFPSAASPTLTTPPGTQKAFESWRRRRRAAPLQSLAQVSAVAGPRQPGQAPCVLVWAIEDSSSNLVR